jgi:O-antigen ligase
VSTIGGLWTRLRAGYTEAALLLFLTVLFVTVYFGATTNLPPLMFLAGVLCIGCFNPAGRVARAFGPVMGATAAILILGFLRSDFVAMLLSGKGVQEAWHLSTRYFRAPMIMWVTTWALIFAVCGFSGMRARRTLTWMSWMALALLGIQAIDAIGNDGLRNWINVHWFGHARPEMVIVDASNLNTFLLMLVWPLAFWFAWRGWLWAIILMVITVLWSSVTVDTNAQAVTLAASAVVFWIARAWPGAWSRRGLLPERVLAVLSAFWVLVFPLVIIGLMRAGLAKPLHDHLPASWAARIDIWTYAVSRALERPWFGWGYESARLFEPYIPDHPHNLSLQAWLELGIPGLVLLAGLWFCIFWFLAPRGAEKAASETTGLQALDVAPASAEVSVAQRARPYMLAAAANYFLLNAISYGMWKQWLHCVAAMMLITGILAIKAVRFETKADNALSDKAG